MFIENDIANAWLEKPIWEGQELKVFIDTRIYRRKKIKYKIICM